MLLKRALLVGVCVITLGSTGCSIDLSGLTAFLGNLTEAAYDVNPHLASQYEANDWQRPDGINVKRAEFYETRVGHLASHYTCDDGFTQFCDHDHPNATTRAEHYRLTGEWPSH